MLFKILRTGAVVGSVLASSAVFALPHNTNPLPAPIGTNVAESTLVKDALVTFMSSDLWHTGYVITQLTTTNTNNWANNECSTNYPSHTGHYFAVDAAGAATDNKLQKLMSLLQTAQLTGMQVTITGVPVTGIANQASDCDLSKFKHVYLRNTTY